MRRPGLTLAAGLGVLLLLAAPALGMRLGMPAAGVVDRGEQSRDGYDAVVDAFGPGAPAPMFATVAAADAGTVVDLARTDPGVVAAAIVVGPAATGRTVVRITPWSLPSRQRVRRAVRDASMRQPRERGQWLPGLLR